MKINIHRSRSNRVIGGVLGGLSKHYHWNPLLVRVLFALLTLTPPFPGIIVYLILWIVMQDPE
ncbi:PspC domain-containing protein [Lentilactobacillus diolivorans]|uniref:Phage shock protein PspC N-terminal domain-containing protein n=2 Tax=Lentilactobacillus diolivorans TaxID=179838 RepID=A0A0R1SRM9_9LACO|nr:PspC domain-containing protein [Lentilactobacillus diolivorans]KRL68936.1 hypothetical protein FC85_GL002153 [Lentilactobacillus diolivorans DSM 14421]GEP22618.1 PspC domain-containing protein [Lentilactobacillus diolivorans]